MLKYIKDKYEAIKAWFKNSETIFLARLETFSGIVLAAAASINWEQLINLDFSNPAVWNQFTIIGGIMFIKGLITEWARKRNATDL